MKNTIVKLILLSVCVALSSCEREDPMAKEQYIKQIYMVGAYQGVSTFSIRYGTEPQNGYVSVAVSGSRPLDQDVTVTLAENNSAIGAYNSKYMGDNVPAKYQRLPGQFFNMPSMSGLLKAGEVYARIPFSVNTQSMHCDSLYAVAFNIASVSAYQYNPATPILILNLKLENDYSGSYDFQAVKYTVTPIDTQTPETAVLSEPSSITSVTRTLKAVDINTVRFFHEARPETRNGYNSNEAYWQALRGLGVTFSRKSADSDEFEIKNWMKHSTGNGTSGLNILAGKATYNDGIFTFWYDYMETVTENNRSVTYRRRIRGTLARQ